MDEGIDSIWNIDGAQFYNLFMIKVDFIQAIRNWELENAYWAARTLRMEIDAKLKRKEENRLLAEIEEGKAERKNKRVISEKEETDSFLEKVDEEREIYLKSPHLEESKTKFYFVLEEFYMYLCHLMKKHRMYYREGEDTRLAILRR